VEDENTSEKKQQPGGASDPAPESPNAVPQPEDPASDYVFGVPEAVDLATSAPVVPAKPDDEVAKTMSSSNRSQPTSDTDLEGDVPPPPTYADLLSKNLPAVVPGSAQSSAAQPSGGNASTGSPTSPGSDSAAGSPNSPGGNSVAGSPSNSGDNSVSAPSNPVAVQAGDAAGVPAARTDKFAVDEVITFAWKEMLKYFWPLTGVLTCNFLVQMVPTVTSMVMTYCVQQTAGVGLLSGVMSLIGGILGLIIAAGLFNVWLRIVDGDTVSVRDVYSKSSRTWNFALAALLYGIMVVAGYICLIVPGVYLQLRFQFFSYFILDSNAGPITSLKASWAISKGSLAELFFLGIVTYFISWVGMLCLLIGAYPAYLVQQIALAKTYRLLRKNTPLSEMPPNLMPLALIADSEPPLQSIG
jgi:hypothetical protein